MRSHHNGCTPVLDGKEMIEWVMYFSAYFLAGLMLKMGDDFLDELNRSDLSWVPLAISGILFGLIMTVSEWDLALMTSIIIGVLASGKVNRPPFLVGFVAIAIVVILRGLPTVSGILDWLALVVMMFLAAVLDERGNDWANQQISPAAYQFFRFRFTLKISVLLLSIPWPLLLPTAIGLWFFDLGYEIVAWIVKNRLQESLVGKAATDIFKDRRES
jgi:ABC-type amino acid transport system permease subunit